ncbi:type I polyketide synthase loading module domain protein [Mycobacterium ulcerans str. Harvey]|uniref:Type I polyketide synthase loading module domain protein n=1 Tax=Mycobacterium ulcerans str. Harvey TaxID=1299332 RepID=A0ABP3AT89_MYCUL|nr:type I polyketide synthase loading module domain protein [Mycobacterium ulcerans str. Harvey]
MAVVSAFSAGVKRTSGPSVPASQRPPRSGSDRCSPQPGYHTQPPPHRATITTSIEHHSENNHDTTDALAALHALANNGTHPC